MMPRLILAIVLMLPSLTIAKQQAPSKRNVFPAEITAEGAQRLRVMQPGPRRLDVLPPSADRCLGVGDTFEVRVFGEPDLSGAFKVGAEGNINFPLLGVLHVAGLDAQAAAQAIANRLREGILRDPQVIVLIREQ
jgi:protein involved in polysaccharide export with SLBB domain